MKGINIHTTDEQLMQAVAKDQLDAMRILFDRHHKSIFNYLYRRSQDKGLSEDICQEVFYKAIRYRKSYQAGKPFLPWIYRITQNSYQDFYKKEETKKRAFSELSVEDLLVPSKANALPEKTQERLHWAMNQLKEEDKNLLILNRIQGLKYAEIAEITDSNTGAVKVRINRILQKLRKIYFKDFKNQSNL